MPARNQEQKLFDDLVAYVFQNFPKWGREVNETLAAFNAALAGGAYALPYTFDTATADADPGAGKLRLSSAAQNASTVMRLDLTAGGQDYTTLIDTFDASTSLVKGTIRLTKQGDMSKWMTFDVSARTAPAGYRNLAVVCTGSSSTSPFVSGDSLLLFFQRTGDRGQIGARSVDPLAAATITSQLVAIDYPNIFNPIYDKYSIELNGVSKSSSGTTPVLQLVTAGGVVTSGYSGGVLTGNGTTASGLALASSSVLTGTAEIRNANGVLKSLEFRGFGDTRFQFAMGAGISMPEPARGFRIIPGNSDVFTAGTIRVFGHRND
ncbi:hypothetical protein ACFOHT_10155 [Massilia oculi]|nr:hypothetical protein [Massilia oculi]